MSTRFDRSDVIFIQQGSSQTLRVNDESKWYVVREEWEGSRILNSTILASYDTEETAAQERNIRIAATTLGRKGGSAISERKAISSRINGRLGGRPKQIK